MNRCFLQQIAHYWQTLIHYGEPIAITREEDFRNYDKSCRQLEEALNLGTQQAREYLRKINISPQDN